MDMETHFLMKREMFPHCKKKKKKLLPSIFKYNQIGYFISAEK